MERKERPEYEPPAVQDLGDLVAITGALATNKGNDGGTNPNDRSF